MKQMNNFDNCRAKRKIDKSEQLECEIERCSSGEESDSEVFSLHYRILDDITSNEIDDLEIDQCDDDIDTPFRNETKRKKVIPPKIVENPFDESNGMENFPNFDFAFDDLPDRIFDEEGNLNLSIDTISQFNTNILDNTTPTILRQKKCMASPMPCIFDTDEVIDHLTTPITCKTYTKLCLGDSASIKTDQNMSEYSKCPGEIVDSNCCDYLTRRLSDIEDDLEICNNIIKRLSFDDDINILSPVKLVP